MAKSSVPSLDLTKEEDFLRTYPKYFFATAYETKLPGQGIMHFAHPACEYNEATYQQHCVVVHLKPEQNSVRRLGDLVEVESPNVGDIAIVPAKVNHWQRIETQVCEGIILTIEPQIISRIAYESVNPERVKLLPTFAKSDPLIQHLAFNIKRNVDSEDYDKLYAESLHHTLSMHLFKNYSKGKFNLKEYGDGLPPYKLKQAIDYINDNLDRQIKIKDVARLIDISQYYFCRLFSESTGVSPYRYVIQQRIVKAQNLMKNGKLSLSDIAYECGFSSQSQMTQHFHKCVGVTPKVYKNRL